MAQKFTYALYVDPTGSGLFYLQSATRRADYAATEMKNARRVICNARPASGMNDVLSVDLSAGYSGRSLPVRLMRNEIEVLGPLITLEELQAREA